MYLPSGLIILSYAVTINAGFGGTPAGGNSPGQELTFPNCAKQCINTPTANFDSDISNYCTELRTKECCIINACHTSDKDLTYQISERICNYVKKQVTPFSCAPSRIAVATLSSTHSSTPTSSHSTVPTHTTSHTSIHSTLSTPSSRSLLPSTLRTSTRSSTHSSSVPSRTPSSGSLLPSTLHTSTHSSAHSSSVPSSTPSHVGGPPPSSTSSSNASATSKGPPTAHRTLSVYNGYVGAYCYTEGTGGRALTGTSSTSSNMTIETCINSCERTGWRYAGLEGSNVCYCGSDLMNGSAQTDASTCSLGCAGDMTENCGGTKALSVYESG